MCQTYILVQTGRGQVSLHQLRDDLRGVLPGLALHLHGDLLQRARLAARHELRQLLRVDRQHVLQNVTILNITLVYSSSTLRLLCGLTAKTVIFFRILCLY